jgi:predicted N-formylglutamate amidohydrolase
MTGLLAMAERSNDTLVHYHPSRDDGALTDLMVIGDHAANIVPSQVELGIDAAILDTHRAVDLGTRSLSEILHERHGCAVANACVSRLVVDLNRFRDEPSTIPHESDGIAISGNILDDRQYEARLSQYYDGYHDRVGQLVEREKPRFIIFLHSFTPELENAGAPRPWHYGVMYDNDERAAHIALNYFANLEILAGDQLPYSGKIYNSSFGRHAGTRNIAHLGLEVRQDLLTDEQGIDAAARVIKGLAEAVLYKI